MIFGAFCIFFYLYFVICICICTLHFVFETPFLLLRLRYFVRICIYICILYSIFKITFLLWLPHLPLPGAPISYSSHLFVFLFVFVFIFAFLFYTFSTVAPARTCLPPQVPRLTEFEKSSRGHSAPAPCPALLIIALT